MKSLVAASLLEPSRAFLSLPEPWQHAQGPEAIVYEEISQSKTLRCLFFLPAPRANSQPDAPRGALPHGFLSKQLLPLETSGWRAPVSAAPRAAAVPCAWSEGAPPLFPGRLGVPRRHSCTRPWCPGRRSGHGSLGAAGRSPGPGSPAGVRLLPIAVSVHSLGCSSDSSLGWTPEGEWPTSRV